MELFTIVLYVIAIGATVGAIVTHRSNRTHRVEERRPLPLH